MALAPSRRPHTYRVNPSCDLVESPGSCSMSGPNFPVAVSSCSTRPRIRAFALIRFPRNVLILGDNPLPFPTPAGPSPSCDACPADASPATSSRNSGDSWMSSATAPGFPRITASMISSILCLLPRCLVPDDEKHSRRCSRVADRIPKCAFQFIPSKRIHKSGRNGQERITSVSFVPENGQKAVFSGGPVSLLDAWPETAAQATEGSPGGGQRGQLEPPGRPRDPGLQTSDEDGPMDKPSFGRLPIEDRFLAAIELFEPAARVELLTVLASSDVVRADLIRQFWERQEGHPMAELLILQGWRRLNRQRGPSPAARSGSFTSCAPGTTV